MSRIRSARKAAGLTQVQVAAYSGVARANIAAYEAGTRPLSAVMEQRILSAMRRPSQALDHNRTTIKARLAEAHLDNVRVFGSVARGEDTPNSDVDLLVDAAPGATVFKLAGARADLVDLLGFNVDIVTSRSLAENFRHVLDEAIAL